MTEINNRIEEVKIAELIGKDECLFQDGSYPCPKGEGINGSNMCDYCKARQICQLFPQPLDDKELREKALLTDEDIKSITFGNYTLPENRAVAEAQQDRDFALLQPKIEEVKARALEAGKLLGRREVVEFIKTRSKKVAISSGEEYKCKLDEAIFDGREPDYVDVTIYWEEWLAKLKEWGESNG